MKPLLSKVFLLSLVHLSFIDASLFGIGGKNLEGDIEKRVHDILPYEHPQLINPHNTYGEQEDVLPQRHPQLPNAEAPELPRYRKSPIDPDIAIEKDSVFHHDQLSSKSWTKYQFRRLFRFLRYWVTRIFSRSKRRFSGVRPQRHILSKEGQNFPRDLVLDGNRIKASFDKIRDQTIDDIMDIILGDHLQRESQSPGGLGSLLDEFRSIKITDPPETEKIEHLVEKIVSSMQDQVKSTKPDDHAMLSFLQMIKCLGYFNAHAADYFLEKIFVPLNDLEIARMWRVLIDCETEFQDYLKGSKSVYPGRYNNFLGQAHFEWTAANEKDTIVKKLKEAIETQQLPKDLEKDLKKLQEDFANLQLNINWPVIDKGYYEDTYSIISKSEKFLRKCLSHEVKDLDEKLSHTIPLVYRILNHLHRFDSQSKNTPALLIKLLQNPEIQKGFYVHVLAKEGLSHHNVDELRLIEDFGLRSRLDMSMNEYLIKEWDREFYNHLPKSILKSEELPHKRAEDIRRAEWASNSEELRKLISESNEIHPGKLPDFMRSLAKLKFEDVNMKEEPDYRISKELAAHKQALDQESFLEETVNAILRNLDNFVANPSSVSRSEKEATLLALNALVKQNHMAWHLTRSHLTQKTPTWNYLKGFIAGHGEALFPGEQLDDKLGFLHKMQREILEYEARQKLSQKLSEELQRTIMHIQLENMSNDRTLPFLYQYTHFLKTLSHIWHETRWGRVEGGSYDVQTVEIAKDALNLIQDQAFASIPDTFKTGFINILSHLNDWDSTGFLEKYLKDAANDMEDYRAFQYFLSCTYHIHKMNIDNDPHVERSKDFLSQLLPER